MIDTNGTEGIRDEFVKSIYELASEKIKIQDSMYNHIDTKSMWAVTFASFLVGVMLEKYGDKINLLLVISLICYLACIGLNLWSLKGRDFYTGVNTTGLTKKYWNKINNKDSLNEFNNEILGNFNDGTEGNKKVMTQKIILFNLSLISISLGILLFIIYIFN